MSDIEKLIAEAMWRSDPEFETVEQEMFKHQPVMSMRHGGVVGCQCMDRVFVTKTEDWGTHLADIFFAWQADSAEPEVEWEYGWAADELLRQSMRPKGPRVLLDNAFHTPEEIAEFPRGERIGRRKAGPWFPVEDPEEEK